MTRPPQTVSRPVTASDRRPHGTGPPLITAGNEKQGLLSAAQAPAGLTPAGKPLQKHHPEALNSEDDFVRSPDLSGEAVTAFGAVISHQYSVHLAEQVKLAQARIKANNGLVAGGTPWGYVIGGEKYSKTLAPTDRCREVIPQVFRRCIAGDSCRTIAMWLDSAGVPTMRGGRWSEGSVHRVLTNMTYAGRGQDEGDIKANGKPSRKNRQTVMTCQAVISMDVYQRAQDALRNRPQRGPGAAAQDNPNRPLLVKLRCARCGAPMYRVKTQCHLPPVPHSSRRSQQGILISDVTVAAAGRSP